jgi:hypothetical protein
MLAEFKYCDFVETPNLGVSTAFVALVVLKKIEITYYSFVNAMI